MSVITCSNGSLIRGNTSNPTGYNCVGKIEIGSGTNVFLGNDSGTLNVSSFNTVIGTQSLKNNTSGAYNTAIGYRSQRDFTAGVQNVSMGNETLELSNNNANFNIAIGDSCLHNDTTGTGNIGIGEKSMKNMEKGNQNVSIGSNSLLLTENFHNNTVVGYNALPKFNNQIIPYPDNHSNIAIGCNALQNLDSGYLSIGIGRNTNDTIQYIGFVSIGALSGSQYTRKLLRNSVLIGYNSKCIRPPGVGYNGEFIAIGNGITFIEKDQILIGNGLNGEISNTHTTYIDHIYSTPLPYGSGVLINSSGRLGTVVSSKRFKENIKLMGDLTSKIMSLKPVEFVYKSDNSHIKQYGLIAEEVSTVWPELVLLHTDKHMIEEEEIDSNGNIKQSNITIEDEEEKPYTVKYHFLPPILLNEFIKIHGEKEQIKIELSTIRAKKEQMKNRLEHINNQTNNAREQNINLTNKLIELQKAVELIKNKINN